MKLPISERLRCCASLVPPSLLFRIAEYTA